MGGTLQCQLDTSLRHLPYDNLNQLKKRSLRCALHRWTNRKAEFKKSNDVQGLSCVPFLWYYRAFHEVKHVEKLREHVKVVMDKNGHCAGSIEI